MAENETYTGIVQQSIVWFEILSFLPSRVIKQNYNWSLNRDVVKNISRLPRSPTIGRLSGVRKLSYDKYLTLDVMMYVEHPEAYEFMFAVNKIWGCYFDNIYKSQKSEFVTLTNFLILKNLSLLLWLNLISELVTLIKFKIWGCYFD
jgi:hypothetical protein